MTPLTDIVIPFASVLTLGGIVWGAATLIRGHKAVDDVNREKIKQHDDECKADRTTLSTRVRKVEDQILELKHTKMDKP